jgi:hypothetical protein
MAECVYKKEGTENTWINKVKKDRKGK